MYILSNPDSFKRSPLLMGVCIFFCVRLSACLRGAALLGRRPPYYRLSTSDFGPPCSARVWRERPVYSLSERQAGVYWYHFYHVFGMTRPRIDPDLPQPNQTLYRGGKLSGKHQMASQKYPASAEDRTHDRRIDSSARYHCAIAPLD